MEYWIEVENGVSIYVEELNPQGKETILFIHGWSLNHNAFEYQYDEIPFAGFRCISMDIRGFGNSSKPINGYMYDRLADDVHQVIETLGLNRITILGHCMGGAIAVRYMARYNQEHVKNLILCGAMVPSLVRRSDFNYGVSIDSINELIQDAKNNRPEMLARYGDLCFFQFVTDSLANWFLHLGLQAAGYAAIHTAITFRDSVLLDDLPKIKVSTLILHGVHDRVVPYSLASIMKNKIANSNLIAFEESGHMLFYEEKRKFNRTVMDFINKPEP